MENGNGVFSVLKACKNLLSPSMVKQVLCAVFTFLSENMLLSLLNQKYKSLDISCVSLFKLTALTIHDNLTSGL